jgi:AraC-like DNA-binding protein
MSRGKRVGARNERSLSVRESVATVCADALRDFDELVTMLGGTAGALLRQAKIDPATLHGTNGSIPYDAMIRLFERASADLNCPDFGMRLAALQAARAPRRIMGPLHLAMRNSPTLGDALRYCADHAHAYTTAIRICFEKLPDDPRVFIPFEIVCGAFLQHRQAVEHALALTQHAIRALSGDRTRAREIWFSHEPLASLATYRANFDATVRFGQSMTGLFVENQDLALPIPRQNPQLYEIATSFIDNRFPAATTSLRTRVRAMVARLLVEGNCTHEHVASALALHPRTLQRRLRDEGESFEGIKDSVRRDVALRYLQQPNVPLVRVTEILGYSETSVLSRSCHRWFCASPRELRTKLAASS